MATGRLPDPNTAPLTAKGDLYTYSTVPARLAVGSNGDTLVADSSASTGLRWTADWNTGKNKIINGDFAINQRSFSSTTTNNVFGFDRWFLQTNQTVTYSAQTFTPGTAPVAGYEGINFARMASTAGVNATDFALLTQKIEDVRTFANQTVTVSFWAKAASGTPKLGAELVQYFGSGGSSPVTGTGQSVTLSTAWARYSGTFSVPSISGKTIGTGSHLELNFWVSGGSNYNTRSGSVGHQTATIDIWGVQVEAGSVATPFTTATGTLAGELAACQRYYWRTLNAGAYSIHGTGFVGSATETYMTIPFPVPMRVAPTSIDFSNIRLLDSALSGFIVTALTQLASSNSSLSAYVNAASTGMTAGRFALLGNNNNTAGYVGFSAEL